MLLFDTQINYGATFSNDRKYRYKLWRIWDKDKSKVMFIGLNPSTANEEKDDPTIRRCISFAKTWGHGGLYMTNLYAFVSTNPNDLIISGEDLDINDHILIHTAKECAMVIFAWGCFHKHSDRMERVIKLFDNPYCIKKSKDGYPCHPLFLSGNLKPIKFYGQEFNNAIIEKTIS